MNGDLRRTINPINDSARRRPERAAWSIRDIAKACGVSRAFRQRAAPAYLKTN
jgi:hypothetical protein